MPSETKKHADCPVCGDVDDFEVACRAFDLMSAVERRRVLERFATLRYPSIGDRFFEAVHQVITGKLPGQVR